MLHDSYQTEFLTDQVDHSDISYSTSAVVNVLFVGFSKTF